MWVYGTQLIVTVFFHNVISVRFILVSPVFELFCGGASVAVPTAFTMVADSVSPEERYVSMSSRLVVHIDRSQCCGLL